MVGNFWIEKGESVLVSRKVPPAKPAVNCPPWTCTVSGFGPKGGAEGGPDWDSEQPATRSQKAKGMDKVDNLSEQSGTLYMGRSLSR